MPNKFKADLLKEKENNSEGIAAYIVALMFGLIVLVVFSIFAYVTKDIGIETRESDASRAFSAAEAGVEALIVGGISAGSGSFDNDRSSYEGNIGDIAEGETEYNYPKDLKSGESAVLWFVSQDASGNLTCSGEPCYAGNSIDVCWGDNSGDDPAVEVSLYYDESNPPSNPNDFSAVEVARVALDRDAGANNNEFDDTFTNVPCVIDGTTYQYGANIVANSTNFGQLGCSGAGCLLMMSVRVLYNSSPQPVGFRVSGGSTLPSQGKRYDVVGTSAGANSRVVVEEPYLPIPPIFDAAIFSPQDIEHL